MRIVLSICLLTLFNTSILCAQNEVDSLLHVLERMPDDTSRLETLKELVRVQVWTKPDSALPYAIAYYELARTTDDQVLQGQGANFIGLCHQTKNDHTEAMEYFILSLGHFEKGDDPWFTAMLHNNIGAVHQKEQQFAQATKKFDKALKGFTAIQDTIWMSNVQNNLGNIYFHTDQFDSAAYYYRRIIDGMQHGNNPAYLAAAEMNLANSLMAMDSLDQAMEYYELALEHLPEDLDAHSYANIHINMGHCLNLLGHNDSAYATINKGMDVGRSAGLKEILQFGNENLSKLYESEGRYDLALDHFQEAIAWKDSIYNEEKSLQIAELEERYDGQKKDLEIERNRAALERSDLQNKALAGGALLLLLAGVFAFRAYRIKKKSSERLAEQNAVIEQALSEKELLLREIHHRVKNNLQVISSLLSLQSRKISDEKALEAVTASRNRVKSMALIHQNLYKEDDLTGIDIADYIEKLANSLMSSYKVDEEKVDVITDIQSMSLDVDTTIPLGLILNELITNALKYAFPEGRSGTVAIGLKEKEDTLQLEVRDNGIGYDLNAERGEESSSFGFNMINAFCKKLKAEWEVKNDNGTVVSIRIHKYELAS